MDGMALDLMDSSQTLKILAWILQYLCYQYHTPLIDPHNLPSWIPPSSPPSNCRGLLTRCPPRPPWLVQSFDGILSKQSGNGADLAEVPDEKM